MRSRYGGALLIAALLCTAISVGSSELTQDTGPEVPVLQLEITAPAPIDVVMPTFAYETSGAVAFVALSQRSSFAELADLPLWGDAYFNPNRHVLHESTIREILAARGTRPNERWRGSERT